MTEIAKGLAEDVVADLAAYYAGQRKREPDPSTLADPRAAIVQLVELGDPKRGLPPCASCHRPGSGGPIETPILAEQNHDDLVRQLETYARTERRQVVVRDPEAESRPLSEEAAVGRQLEEDHQIF